MDISVGSATDVGHVRQGNEDALVAQSPVFAVADGMGGHAAGEVASSIVATCLADLAGRDNLDPEDVVRQLVQANERVLASARLNPEQEGMGTTVTGVALVEVAGEQQWALFNVGDSRVYELDERGLQQVSVDHSLVQEMVDAGVLSSAEAARHPSRNVVTRSMGHEPMVEIAMSRLPVRPGQRFVICSDGLSDELDAKTIETVLRACPQAQPAARALVLAALDAGGRDNVTVVVVDVR